jgi:hypothetical protein
MKKFILLVFFILPFFLFAQKSKKKKIETTPRIFLTGSFLRQVSELNIKKDLRWNLFHEEDITIPTQKSNGFTLGLGYKVGRKMDILHSLVLQKYNFSQIGDFNYTRCTPESYGATEISYAIRYVKSNMLGINTDFRYKLINNRHLIAYTGLGLNFNIINTKQQSIDIHLDNNLIVHHWANEIALPIENKLNVIPSIKVGLMYRVLKPLYVKIEPFFAYSLLHEKYISVPTATNLYTYGLQLGIEYRLGKL